MFQIQEVDDDGNLAAKPTPPVEEKPKEKKKDPLPPESGAWKQGIEKSISIDKMKEYYTFTKINESMYLTELKIKDSEVNELPNEFIN